MSTLVRRQARGAPALASKLVRVAGDRMLDALELGHAELSVLLTNDKLIQALNCEHRGKDRPTDVLAFPLDAGDEEAPLLGDVVISLETAERQAARKRHALLFEVRFLLAHGVLHLCGHDHVTDDGKREMDRMTRRLVRAARQD
jgi:probable rRNA maturation factor